MGLIIKGVEIGIDVIAIYEYTPAEIELSIECAKIRDDKRYNDLMRIMYTQIYFDRQRNLPKIDDFLEKNNNRYFPVEKKSIKELNKEIDENVFLEQVKALNSLFGGKVE